MPPPPGWSAAGEGEALEAQAGVCVCTAGSALCHTQRMSCDCGVKVHSSSPALQLLLSTLHFPNVSLSRAGSSLRYPEPSGFPWILLGFAGSWSLSAQAGSGVTLLIHGAGMELGRAVGKAEDWHLPPWPET